MPCTVTIADRSRSTSCISIVVCNGRHYAHLVDVRHGSIVEPHCYLVDNWRIEHMGIYVQQNR